MKHSSTTAKSERTVLGPELSSFSTVGADDNPVLLRETFRLRYQAYCVERAFLDASDYPDQLEQDEFDPFSKHFATLDQDSRVVGTIRLVYPSVLGLPLFRHCTLFPGETTLLDPQHSIAEISRLAVVRQCRPNAFGGDGALFSLYRSVYHHAKRTGMTHWVVAAEVSLQRTLASYGFPFRQIGPEVDYWGPVAPYLLDLSVLDRILLTDAAPRLDGFLDGLDAEHRPKMPRPRL